MAEMFKEWIQALGASEGMASVLSVAASAVTVLLAGIFARILVRYGLLKALKVYIKFSGTRWEDILIRRKVVSRLSNFAPAVIIHMFAAVFPAYEDLIRKLSFSYLVIAGLLVIDPLLDSVDEIYRRFEVSKEKPIKGFIQIIKLMIYIIGIVVVIGIMIDRSPWLLLSSIGALTAVLLLVFQNTILGFVAGIQLTSNDMVRLGDWIEMPKYNADGDVIDITLHTVKVQNWDNTITTIPTHALIADSFKNWRGMQESGGRRIKRSVYIDMNSIAFCTEEMLQRFEQIYYLTEYIRTKRKEIEAYNKQHGVDPDQRVSGRRMTNIGTFRAYVSAYLKAHPKVHQGLISMVRQMPPDQHGLPIEIYCFTNDTAWVNYESIQADIFDHIFSVLPQFGLRVFQSPSGQDFKEGLRYQQLPKN